MHSSSLKQELGTVLSALATDLLLDMPHGLKCDVAELTFDQVNDVARVRFDGFTPNDTQCSGVIELSLDGKSVRAFAKTDVGSMHWSHTFHCGYTQSFSEFVHMLRVAVSVALSHAN